MINAQTAPLVGLQTSNDHDSDGCVDIPSWATKILFDVNQSGENSIIDMVIQEDSSIIVYGYFSNTLSYQNISLQSNGETDIFVIKILGNGRC